MNRFHVFSMASIALTVMLGLSVDTFAQTGNRGRDAERQSPSQSGKPNIEFESRMHDFGVVYDESSLETAMKFRNTGDANLIIERVTTSCGCTAAVPGQKMIAPGESGELNVTFDPKPKAGTQKKRITVYTNDPDEPQAQVEIQTKMVPVVALEPSPLRLGTVQHKKTQTMQLRVFSRDENFEIKDISYDNDAHISHEVIKDATPEEPDPEMPGFRIVEFSVHADAPIGSFFRNAEITTIAAPQAGQKRTEHEHSLRIVGRIRGDLSLNPRFLRVREMQAGEEFSAFTVITTRSGSEFEVTETELKESLEVVEDINIELEPMTYRGKPAYKLTLTGRNADIDGERPRPYRGDIVVRTDIEDEEEISIAFNGQVRPEDYSPSFRSRRR